MTRKRQRGSAMLVTLVVISALLAGAAVLVSMQMSSGRSTELTRNGLSSLYCAEAGLAMARAYVTANYGQWDAALAAGPVEPAWLTGIDHDIDNPGDSVNDFVIYIRDNDEADNDYNDDNDEQVFIVSRCIKYPDSPRQVEELIHYKPALNPYNCQQGGIAGRGNDNDHTLDTCDGN